MHFYHMKPVKTHWIHQLHGYELGNLIMTTPAIRALSEHLKKPIPVLFDTPALIPLFEGPYIEPITKPPRCNPILTSKNPKRIGNESDYQANFRIIKTLVRSIQNKIMPEPFVYSGNYEFRESQKCIAIFNGRRNINGDNKSPWIMAKVIPETTIQSVIKAVIDFGCIPVLLGGVYDKQYFGNVSHTCIDLIGKTNLPESLSVLSQCIGFIGNDSGLYHCGSAMKKRGLVLWKQTNFNKNKCPSSIVSHTHSVTGCFSEYASSVHRFIDGMLKCN